MSIQAISTKVVSTLGNKESLIPLIVKDGVDSASLTYKSYKEGGVIEGTDRAIDEFGTQAIWIGGIPFYKKLIDKTAYHAAKINPEVDPRVIANNEYASWAKENAKGIMSNTKNQSVKSALTDCLIDGGNKAKALFKGKVIAATALTLATYFGLTKYKQYRTKKSVLNNMQQKVNSSDNLENKKASIFNDIEKIGSKTNNLSFKGSKLSPISEAIMFNPVHNMKIIDAGITTERLVCSRNTTELGEHAIKEGGFLFSLYGLGNILEKGVNLLSDKVLNKPIDLDIDVLMDNNFSAALENGKLAADIENLPQKGKSLTEKLDFIVKNPDNAIVQAAKKSKIVSEIKDKSGASYVDTSKYIDINEFEKLTENIKKINDKYLASNEPVRKYLNKVKALKVSSVMTNIILSCIFLSCIIPKAVYQYRKSKTGTTSFHVANAIKNDELKKEYSA